MRKVILLLIASIVVLAGCSYNPNTITVGMWEGGDHETEAIEEIARLYEEETGWAVEIRTYTDYEQQLTTELVGGEAPDVFYVDLAAVEMFVAEEALLPLNEYVPQETLDLFYESQIDAFTVDEQLYAMPKDWATMGMFCNEDLLAEAGSSCDEIPAELTDFPAWAEGVQENMPEGTYVFGFANNIDRNFMWLEANGASIITEDGKSNLSDPAVVANAKELQKIGQSPAYVSQTDAGLTSAEELFLTETAAITFVGTWAAGQFNAENPDLNWSVHPLPTFMGDQCAPIFSTGYGVNANSENIEQAVDFAVFASTEAAHIMTSAVSALPSNTLTAEQIGADTDPYISTLMTQEPYATPWNKGQITKSLVTEWGNYAPLVETGDMTIEEMMENIDTTINSNTEIFNE